MKSLNKNKVAIKVMTTVASVIGLLELHWLRSQKSIEFETWEFGIYMLPWLCMSAGFLALLYLNLFFSERATGRAHVLLKIGFTMIIVMVLALWIAIISRFVTWTS